MPGLNRKGPAGQGAMSGMGLGKCNPENRGKSDEEIFQSRDRNKPINENNLGMQRGMGLRNSNRRGLGKGMCRRNQIRLNNNQ